MIQRRLQVYGLELFLMIICVLLMQTNAYPEYLTNLYFREYIQDSVGNIDVGEWSVPVVYDWDSDGNKDLLVGQRYDHPTFGRNGYVSFYQNVGSNNTPHFDSSSFIHACLNSCILAVPGWG